MSRRRLLAIAGPLRAAWRAAPAGALEAGYAERGRRGIGMYGEMR